MSGNEIFEIVANVIGGLCIFLLGMKHMSEGMQAVAGNRLRRMIAAVTDNRVMGCLTGTAVTALIQSSSVTTVMLVGMVNAGVMTFTQSIGVILGADIGTTVTAWIVALKVLQYGLPLLGVTGFVYLFSRNDRVRYTALMFMGIGMVFFGLELMKHGLEPLRHAPGFVELFSRFEPKTYFGVIKCILIGAFVTAVVQSSSATVAITITLARTGALGYDTAVALVLGQNIGTTITAFLASLGTSTNAKRVAYAHVLIKAIGVALMAIVFFPYMHFLRAITSESSDIAARIALAHTVFNVVIVAMFLPLRAVLIRIVERMAPTKGTKEPPRLTFLDIRLLDTPAFGLEQSIDEIKRMAGGTVKMLTWLRTIVATDGDVDPQLEKKIFHREEVLDIMQKEIVEFLSHLLGGSVSREAMEEARRQLRLADEYESISDYLSTILKLYRKLRKQGLAMSEDGKAGMLRLHDKVAEYIAMINEAVAQGNGAILSKARTDGDIISRTMKDERQALLKRIEECGLSPLTSLVYVDMLQSYRKVKDHAVNIAETIAGEK